MSEWKTVTLKEVCDVGVSDIKYDELMNRLHNGEYPIYDANGRIKNVDFYEHDKPYLGMNAGSIGTGGVAKYPAYSTVIGSKHYIVPKDSIDIDYLLHALRFKKLRRYAKGIPIPHISIDDYINEKLLLPPIEVQKKINNKLEKAISVEYHSGMIVNWLGDLLEAKFGELFGEKEFPVLKWNDVFETETGKLNAEDIDENGLYPFFTCTRKPLRTNTYAFDQEALILAGNNDGRRYDVKHYSGKFNAHRRTYVLTLKKDWSYEMFKCQLEHQIEYLHDRTFSDDTKYLTHEILSKLSFIILPQPLQKEFSDYAEKVYQAKAKVQKILDYALNLQAEIAKEYFGVEESGSKYLWL